MAGTGARAVLAEQRPNTPHRTFHKTLVQRRDLLPLGLCVEAHTAQGPRERSETQQLQNSTAQWSLPAPTRDVCPAPPAPGRMYVRMYRSFCADETAGRVAHSRALRYNSQRLHRSLGDPPELNASSLHNLTTPRCLIHISRDMCALPARPLPRSTGNGYTYSLQDGAGVTGQGALATCEKKNCTTLPRPHLCVCGIQRAFPGPCGWYTVVVALVILPSRSLGSPRSTFFLISQRRRIARV